MPDFYKNINPHLKFNHTIGENVNAETTVNTIIKTVNTYANSDYIKKVVKILDKGNPNNLEFLKRLFDTCCINVKYQRDPDGHEIIFTPKLLIEVGKGDCKKFTTFILSVLKAKGIEGFAKVVSYDGDSWEHIFAIVPIDDKNKTKHYITMDPVNHCKFNKEVDYKKAQIFYLNGTKSEIMDGNKLSLMGGLGNVKPRKFNFGGIEGISDAAGDFLGEVDQTFSGVRKHGQTCSMHDTNHLAGLGNEYINGTEEEITISGTDDLGKRKNKEQKKAARTQRKIKRKKIFKKAKKLAFLPVRTAFLVLISLAGALQKTKLHINLAGKLAQLWQKDNGKELVKLWETFGGKRETLARAIAKASKKSIHGEDTQILGNGDLQIEGLGVVTEAVVITSITAAAPILIGVMSLLKKHKLAKESETANVENLVEAMPPDVKEVAQGAQTLIDTAKELDGGGNIETQKEIVAESKAEETNPPKEGDGENFKTSAGTEKTDQGKPNKTAVEDLTATTATTTTTTSEPKAASFFSNWKNPLSWLKAAFILSVLMRYHNINIYVANVLQFVTVTMLFITIFNLIITKIKTSYAKI